MQPRYITRFEKKWKKGEKNPNISFLAGSWALIRLFQLVALLSVVNLLHPNSSSPVFTPPTRSHYSSLPQTDVSVCHLLWVEEETSSDYFFLESCNLNTNQRLFNSASIIHNILLIIFVPTDCSSLTSVWIMLYCYILTLMDLSGLWTWWVQLVSGFSIDR